VLSEIPRVYFSVRVPAATEAVDFPFALALILTMQSVKITIGI